MSALSDKILSFGPEFYTTFGIHTNTGAYTTSPVNIGTQIGNEVTWTLSNEAPVPLNEYYAVPSNPGPDNQGCWQWGIGGGGDTTATRFRATSSFIQNWKQLENGGNLPDTYSTGIWFRITAPLANLAQNNPATVIFDDYMAGAGIELKLGGGAINSSAKGKLEVGVAGGAVGGTSFGFATSGVRVDDGVWHYVNINWNRPTTNSFNYEVFLDGASLGGRTGMTVSSPNTIYRQTIGSTTGSPNMGSSAMQIAHLYVKSVALTSAQISEIWQSTQGGTNVSISETPATASALFVDPAISTSSNINFTETPATASALMTDPTIIITSPSYTFVQTSISVSAELLTNISVSATQNLNYVVSTTFNATTELINNVTITTGTNASFSAAEFTATAEIIEPLPLSRPPMTASALMVNPTLAITPNYRQLVKELIPSFYVADPYVVDPNESLIPTFYNDGYDNWGTPYTDNGIRAEFGPAPMSAVGNGNSFYFVGSSTNANRQWGFNDSNAVNSSNYFNYPNNNTNNFTLEFWINFKQSMTTEKSVFDLGPLDIRIDTNSISLTMAGEDVPNDGLPPTYTHTQNFISTLNSWNHFVITGSYSNNNLNLTTQIWYNGALLGTTNSKYVNTIYPGTGILFNDGGETSASINHIALYKQVLTNSQISNHHNFISTASPNKTIYDDAREISATSGDHNFVVTSNAYYDADPIPVSALIVQPTIIAGVSINVPVLPHTASAQLPMPSLKLDITATETAATAYAELLNPFVLSNLYYQYVQANIVPYRYVSFDAANPYADYGTDTDYSVIPTTVNGTIVGPGEAINGKSAKTAGNNYATDGVILKESEHDDNWGTGNNSYHSSFWFRQAPEDTSTGLRVLWNLNSQYDSQNVILYHYQNKLHLQINNQVGNPITVTSANNVNIFDLDRHFIVVASHHNNNNNILYVYVDTVLVLTQNISTYSVTTINNPIHVGANNEANNFPRLGIGCLITPFVNTALPVVPTNTILYIDEVYWDKNDINQTTINALFNMMPDQNNNNSPADTMLADAQSVNATVSTEVVFVQTSMTANAELVMPVVIAELNLITSASPMEASALLMPGEVFEDMEIFPDVMVASAIFNSVGVIISIPAGAMTASVTFPTEIFFSDGFGEIYLDGVYPAYVRHIRADSFNLVSIPRRLEQI
jgi:hypothetical protein